MNKFQAEKKVYAFHAVFRVVVNDIKPFQNHTERHNLIISLICNPCQDFLNNKPMFDSIFAFIDPVSTVYYGGSGRLNAK